MAFGAALAFIAATGQGVAATGQSVAATGQSVAAFGATAPVPGRAADIASEQGRSMAVGQTLGLAGGERLIVKDLIRDTDGFKHVRYVRTFNGLRVIGGDLVSHEDKAGAVKSVSWNASHNVDVPSTTPKVSLASAKVAGAGKAALAQTSSSASTGELVVYAGGATPKLAYDVLTQGMRADQTPSRLHTIVDAITGATLEAFDEIENGTGHGIFVGTVAIGTAAGFSMRDSVGNYTTDLNGSRSATAAGTTFTDADDIWGNGAVSDRASAGVDAHYGAGRTFDYFKNVQGRNGIWNTGAGARSRVHYGNAYNNAFWDGSQMTYGDGSGNVNPLVELDVAGHEMSHGVTQATAALVYTGDAGGLNEANSDIFGTAVEFYANNASDTPDYLIGEKLNLNGNGTPLRYMDKPSKDGASRDCWSSTLGSLDPHNSSGPLNHWFYLASEGSGAKVLNGVSYNSPTCNASTVTPIGRDVAAKIWYRTLSTYLTSNSTYAAARTGAIKSAKDLYGVASAQCAGIAASFSAIAVPAGAETCGSTPPPPVGGNLLLNPGFESGAVSWTGSAGPITTDAARPAHTGSWKMWLGGNGAAATETESQSVTVSATATAPKLSYWIRTDTAESGTTAYDTMKVQVISGTTTYNLATYSNVGTNATYTQKTFDLTAYKGKTISVKFLAVEDATLQTSFVVDDTSVSNN
jgi:Zn-dependent metalloprotease